ncbi:MAG: RluA family pseudouridine synthase [Desulfobacterales bacterium]|nr:RluA family pseudouridine synthase [Desulfobacterales bacterium]
MTRTVGADDPQIACDFLAAYTDLSKARVKDAMAKGAAWLGRRRLRRAKTTLRTGDVLSFHYDPAILALNADPAGLVEDRGRYSVWNKPPGRLCQGTLYADHCSLLYQTERYFTPRRKVWLIHRIDREASGLVLVAHDKGAAAKLSALFRDRHMDKRYRVTVLGKMAGLEGKGRIDAPLDGREAITEYEVARYQEDFDTTDLRVRIHTGRRHQIRRHFDGIGHPVMGDPRYGEGNKSGAGLQLTAVSLAFTCPIAGDHCHFRLDSLLLP